MDVDRNISSECETEFVKLKKETVLLSSNSCLRILEKGEINFNEVKTKIQSQISLRECVKRYVSNFLMKT